MRLDLQCHPLTPVSVVDEISLTYEWHAHESLWLRYHAEGLLHDLDLPAWTEARRADRLWQTTCFELFLQEKSANRYCEFNFSPSSLWAAYQFSNYRDGMKHLQLPKQPDIFLDLSDSHVAIEITLGLPDIWGEVPLNASFSAVIAENSGPKSYWALSHPPGKPDFHHKDCFSHQLKAAGHL
ncbi:DOMON-like domain-containing protein [Sphingorhabdus sp. Alg231-15]|uniref:DOMON-like domain-containing protein n=1 Tax=Sphingorhabdus sp. Alg231-15 TaxID=1922222 RepID=UPI000D559D13